MEGGERRQGRREESNEVMGEEGGWLIKGMEGRNGRREGGE